MGLYYRHNENEPFALFCYSGRLVYWDNCDHIWWSVSWVCFLKPGWIWVRETSLFLCGDIFQSILLVCNLVFSCLKGLGGGDKHHDYRPLQWVAWFGSGSYKRTLQESHVKVKTTHSFPMCHCCCHIALRLLFRQIKSSLRALSCPFFFFF